MRSVKPTRRLLKPSASDLFVGAAGFDALTPHVHDATDEWSAETLDYFHYFP